MSDATHSFVQHLADIVGRNHVLTDPEAQAPWLTDWRKQYTGRALAIVLPGNTNEVAQLVRACADRRIPIVPQGGNTGLVGGGTPGPEGNAVVISLRRMNRVREVDTTDNTISAEAGCVLLSLQEAAAEAGRLFPLTLPSEGSCTLGGNLSTNAGGTGVLRYGNARELCLGLEAVMPDGEIIGARPDGGVRALRKDNTGYDLKDLLIGAEGTLGIITAATMRLWPMPRTRLTAMAAIDSPRAALQLLALAQVRLGEGLTAFELMPDIAIGLVERHFQRRSPFTTRYPYAVLLELSGREDEGAAMERFETLFQEALEEDLIRDAVIAQSIAQSREMWDLRELMSQAQSAEGPNVKHDVSVPVARLADYIAKAGARIEAAWPGARIVCFGHVGDGNLHYNVWGPIGSDAKQFLHDQHEAVNRVVHDCVAEYGGSISAEHGLGQLKREEIRRYKPAHELALMAAIKGAIDPLGIMNPGKVL